MMDSKLAHQEGVSETKNIRWFWKEALLSTFEALGLALVSKSLRQSQLMNDCKEVS
jgi:hypothetical protein